MNRIQGKRWKPGRATAFAGAVLAAGALAMAVAPGALAAPGAPAPAGTGTSAPPGLGAPVPPGEDPFYRPPPGLRAYPPGAVLRAREVKLQGAMQPELKAAYQLLYRTTNPAGQAVATVTTVMIPVSPARDHASSSPTRRSTTASPSTARPLTRCAAGTLAAAPSPMSQG